MNAELNGFRFVKTGDELIEVYDVTDGDFPCSYIRVKAGEIASQKQFQMEIMDWLSKKVK